MKKTLYTFILWLLVAGLPSCDSFFDVNTSPNNPQYAPYDKVYPKAVVGTASVTGGQYAILGSLWSEHFTQSNTAQQYLTWVYYNLTSDHFNSSFNSMYTEALKNYDLAKQDAAEAENWYYYLMATVMECYTFQVLVDLHDQIPFTDALQGISDANISPKYEDGSVVYDGLIARIDDALSKDFTLISNIDPGSNDQLFGGNMDRWMQFANTLKLRIYMRQIYARPDIARAGITALLSANNFLAVDARLTGFDAAVGKQNPLYGSEYERLGGVNIKGCNTFLDFMQQYADTRLPKIYKLPTSPSGATEHKSIPFGSRPMSSDVPNNSLSTGQFAATNPVVFLSAAESQFLQAEAKEWTGGSGKSNYDAGVTASFAKYSLDGSTFIAAGGAYEYPASGTFEDKQKSIITQKWVDCAIANPIESFFEFNRTGYPDILIPSVNSVIGSNFPKRLPFASFEQQRNPNTPEQKRLDVKVWWDKK